MVTGITRSVKREAVMPKGPTKRRPQTVARLLDGALELFAEQGFGGTTIAEVCERAGYTRGAFYSNFATMDDLFFALFDAHADGEVERYDQALAELDGAGGSVEPVIKRLAQVDARESAWFLVSAEFTLYAIRHPDARRVLAEHHARVRAHVVQLLARILERTGRTATVDLEEMARLFISTRDGSLAQSLVEPDRLPAGHLEETFWPILFQALSHP
jgi:AcrR family transcriptional regulator